MQYYQINTRPPYLVRTQREAELDAAKHGTTFKQIEVPDSKGELMDYLNALVKAEPMSIGKVCVGIRQLEAHELAQAAHALGRRITELTGGRDIS